MDNRMSITAQVAARLLFQRFKDEHPYWTSDILPIDELVTWLDLYVETFHQDDYQPGTYGYVDPDEDERLIWLCRDLRESFRRFTLAHELGHAILHCPLNKRTQAVMSDLQLASSEIQLPELSRQDPCHDADVQESLTSLLDEEQFQETLGIGQNYDPRSERELAANIFAAELLMPLERVRTLYLTEQVAPNSLATAFGVSNAAMLNRLSGLLKESTSPLPLETTPAKTPSPPTTKKRYDEFQQAAIEAPTPALIVAGPGSGKTSTLIGRIEYMIHTLAIQPANILALTFSRKATQEMEERLQQVLDTDLPRVSTFHAFCADLLRQHGTLVGLSNDFMLIDEAEGYFILRQQASKLHLRHYQKLQSPAYYFPDMLKTISRAKDELVTPQQYQQLANRMQDQAQDEETMEKAEKALEVARVYALYEEELRRRGDTDFGGLLMLTIQLLRQHPEILQAQQQHYQQLLVDEFQDVNRASGVLLRELAGARRQVWVVGDANQAIYGFRGASPANINQFETDFPGAVVLPLARNYRSRPDLVSIAESFRCRQLELGEEPGKNQPVRLTHPDTYVTLAKAADDISELAGLVEDIQRKHANGYAYKDMIVLCRTRAHAQKISRTLAKAGLPIIERGGMLEQEHIKDVLSILLLLTDPTSMGIMRAAHQAEHPLAQDDIEGLLLAARQQNILPHTLLTEDTPPPDVSEEGRQALLRLSAILQTLQHAADSWSLLAQYLLIETSLVRDLLCDSTNKQNSLLLADYDTLLRLARHYDQQHPIHTLTPTQKDHQSAGDAPPQKTPLQEHIKGFLEYLSILVLLRQDGGNRHQSAESGGEESADIIRAMTVHASKGLEFPIVYMPGLVQRRFPLQARSSPVPVPAGMLSPESEGSAAHESGESCLFYVGVTRARDHLILSYSERYGKQKYKRSLYLDALEVGLDKERITTLHWENAAEAQPTVGEVDQTIISSQPSEHFIDAVKPSILSASAIEAYQRCPRQYAYSVIYRFKGEDEAYQLFWQATQRTLDELRQRVHDAQTNDHQHQNLPTQQEIQELYTRHWQALGGHTTPFAELYEQHGHEVIESIRRTLTTQPEEVTWETRPAYTVDVAGKTVHVTVDRVEAHTQMAKPTKFVRTRFGKRKDKPSAETREYLYARAYRQLHPGQNLELHSHNMSTGEVLPITMTPKKEQSLYDELEQSLQAMERHEYPANPAEPFRCPTCPFFLICPA